MTSNLEFIPKQTAHQVEDHDEPVQWCRISEPCFPRTFVQESLQDVLQRNESVSLKGGSHEMLLQGLNAKGREEIPPSGSPERPLVRSADQARRATSPGCVWRKDPGEASAGTGEPQPMWVS